MEMDATQSWLTITVNGKVMYDAAVGEHDTMENIPCYLSDPWYDLLIDSVKDSSKVISIISIDF